MRILRWTFFLIAIFISSCSKDDDAEPTVEKLLTDKNWKLVSAVADPPIPSGNVLVSDVFATMPACSKDDFTRFNPDGTSTFDEGATKCLVSDPQTVPSRWSFNNDKTILTVTAGSSTVSYKIIELTKTQLKFSFIERDERTETDHTITGVYQAQ